MKIKMTDHSIRVLLVEDSPGDARLVEATLNEGDGAKYQVRTVASMAEALTALAGATFDVVLTDLSLPDCGPNETVERVTAAAARIPIVVLTGMDDEEFGREVLKQGAQDYLVKVQFDRRLLGRAIGYAIERKRTQTELAAARDAAVSTTVPREPAIDKAALARLAEIAPPGSNFMIEIIEAFLGDMTERVAAIEGQVGIRDMAGIAATGHKLKGSCSHFGARGLMQRCVELEGIARSGNTGGLQAAIDCMVAETERVRSELQEYRETQAAARRT